MGVRLAPELRRLRRCGRAVGRSFRDTLRRRPAQTRARSCRPPRCAGAETQLFGRAPSPTTRGRRVRRRGTRPRRTGPAACRAARRRSPRARSASRRHNPQRGASGGAGPRTVRPGLRRQCRAWHRGT
eukprot:6885520-Prymnesium_polylepis.1